MPIKKTKSPRTQYVMNKVLESNKAINEDLRKSIEILNELESDKSHLQKEITDLDSQYVTTEKTIFKFGKKTKMNTIKGKIEKSKKDIDIINDAIKNVRKHLKPYIRKKNPTLKSMSNSKSSSSSSSKPKSSSSTFTRRVKFKPNRIVEFDKSDTVDSLLIKRKGSPKNKTLKKSSK
jgi:predicted  nucleic acid-binding Zn-ribbon protein